MPHVTDGELHAYLDGGLELYPPEEAERVRAHLEVCEACRERLDAERELGERADAVLAWSGPGPVEAPPFEELRRKAVETGRAGGPAAGRRTGLRGVPLAVAATAILAFGVGWMAGRQGATLVVEPGTLLTDDDASSRSALAPRTPAPPAGERAARPSAGEEEAELADAAPPPDPARSQASDELGDEVPVVSERVAEAARQRAPPIGDAPLAAAGTVPAARALPLEGRAAELSSRLAPESRADSLSPVDPVTGGEAGERAPEAADRVVLRGAPSRGPEERMWEGGRVLYVPGLPLVSVERIREPADGAGLRVVQRLPGGALLELRFGGLEGGTAAPHRLLEEPLPEGVRQVVQPFGDGWVVARAPLEPRRIRELLALIS